METDVFSVARGTEGLQETDGSSVSPAARFRKVSTLAYMSSGLQGRERNAQRSIKSFVVVVPPDNFQHAHGALGHTLSSGPSHRHAQGLLMPLFPTVRYPSITTYFY